MSDFFFLYSKIPKANKRYNDVGWQSMKTTFS